MKDNHHITQNQTVKININNSGNKPNKRRSNKPKSALAGGFGGGGGGGGGGFSVPPIIHNDNRPDVSDLENTLQKVYDNQMTQHTYSNYLRNEYASNPRIEPAHYTYNLIGNGEHPNLPFRDSHHPVTLPIEDRYEELEDDDEDEDASIPAPASPAPMATHPFTGAGAGGAGGAPVDPSPPAKKYRKRKDRDLLVKESQLLTRIGKDVKLIENYKGEDRIKNLRNIRGDIEKMNRISGRNYDNLLPEKYH